MGGKIGEILHARSRDGRRNGQRELCALEVLVQHFGGLGGVEVIDEGLLRRQPVAEEEVDFTVLHRLVADRDGERLHVRLVTERLQQKGGHAVGGGDVRPAGIGQEARPDRFAIGGRCRCGRQGQDRGGTGASPGGPSGGRGGGPGQALPLYSFDTLI